MDQGTLQTLGVGDDAAGYSKRHKGLEFVVVYNSGHLVPYNQPVNALDLITRVLKNESFADHKLPSFDFGYTSATTKTTDDARVETVAPYAKGGYRQYRLWLLLPFVAFASFTIGCCFWSVAKRSHGYKLFVV
jgi:hypothetical protein